MNERQSEAEGSSSVVRQPLARLSSARGAGAREGPHLSSVRFFKGSLHGRMRPAQASPLQQRGADVMARRTLPLVFRDSSPFLLSARCSPPLLAETNLGVSARWSCSTASAVSCT